MIQVHICDDHCMLVEGLKETINKSGVAAITKSYATLEMCRAGLKIETPDILLIDIDLPDGDGIAFCKELHTDYPTLKVIILTTFNELSIAQRAYIYGASGYIVKKASILELLNGISKVYQQHLFFPDVLMKDIKEGCPIILWLTNREKQVLQYIANGYSSKEIARLIDRQVDTVKTIKKNIFYKLNVHTGANAVKVAIRQRLIE